LSFFDELTRQKCNFDVICNEPPPFIASEGKEGKKKSVFEVSIRFFSKIKVKDLYLVVEFPFNNIERITGNIGLFANFTAIFPNFFACSKPYLDVGSRNLTSRDK
jgi:hypothetical protein